MAVVKVASRPWLWLNGWCPGQIGNDSWRKTKVPSAKSARVSERKRIRNAPLRSRAKNFVIKARSLIADNDADSAQEAVMNAVVALDKAAQKGAIHKKNASRRKSRLMKSLNQAKDD